MRIQQQLSLAEEIHQGLTHPSQKYLPTHYLYDDYGSALFDEITDLPEYGLTRADRRLLRMHAKDIARMAPVKRIVDLGSGSGEKARFLLSAYGPKVIYSPVDVSKAALESCIAHLPGFVVETVEAEFLPGLAIASSARGTDPILVTFLGSNIGNFDKQMVLPFLQGIRSHLRPGDFLLLGIDLVKPVEQLIAAYDDAAGVTAAFNRNLLYRLNREFDADFQPHCFEHRAVWNRSKCRIEMHLLAASDQKVRVKGLGIELLIRSGETIHTESSHKFESTGMQQSATQAGFRPLAEWVDDDWPFAELLFGV